MRKFLILTLLVLVAAWKTTESSGAPTAPSRQLQGSWRPASQNDGPEAQTLMTEPEAEALTCSAEPAESVPTEPEPGHFKFSTVASCSE